MTTWIPLFVLMFGVLVFSTLYIFSNFSYEFLSNGIIIRWGILGGIPFGKQRIAFDNIKNVRRYNGWRDAARPLQVAGNLFVKPAVLVFLQRGLIRCVFLTPPEPVAFIEKLESMRRVGGK